MGDLSLEPASNSLATLSISPGPSALSSLPSPTSPTRPKRSPLRTPSSSTLPNGAPSSTARESVGAKLKILSREVTRCLDRVYEIQELRHSSTSNHTSARLDNLLSDLDSSLQDVPTRLAALQDEAEKLGPDAEVTGKIEELHANLDELLKQHEMLKDEMKEDGWLSRFRTTADQAEAMMKPLEKSLSDCLRYVENITSSAVPVPLDSELEDTPSINTLQTMSRRHEAMKKTYVPSVSKILKMMDKSINDRTTKNGEALRRFSDMSSRWINLLRQLQQLDARIRIVLSQHTSPSALSTLSAGEVEILAEGPPSYGSSPSDYFGSLKGKPLGSHRSSFSSTTSRSSIPSRPPSALNRLGQSPSTLSPNTASATANAGTPGLRRKSSFMSSTSSSTAKIIERPTAYDVMKTPTNRRISSLGARQGSVSPTPSYGSATSSIVSRGSRIPVLSPKSLGRTRSPVPGSAVPPVPSLSVSTSTTHHFLDGHNMLQTPDQRRPRPSGGASGSYTSMTVPRMSLTPGSRAFSTSSAPRSGISRNPPSSFRSPTPTPSGRPSRPSSRLSMASYTPSAVAPVNLQPFQPSKYDLLDTTVQTVIEEVGFDRFVARVDASMKKGQRRRDDEEWKGEFVFGAGQKTSSVKLLKLAGRTGMGEGPRMKCLVRVAGAWQDLAAVLRKRQEEM